MLCTLLVHSYVTDAHGPRGFCFASELPVCHVFVVVGGQEACGAPSPLQLKPVSPPGELGPGLQDS